MNDIPALSFALPISRFRHCAPHDDQNLQTRQKEPHITSTRLAPSRRAEDFWESRDTPKRDEESSIPSQGVSQSACSSVRGIGGVTGHLTAQRSGVVDAFARNVTAGSTLSATPPSFISRAARLLAYCVEAHLGKAGPAWREEQSMCLPRQYESSCWSKDPASGPLLSALAAHSRRGPVFGNG